MKPRAKLGSGPTGDLTRQTCSRAPAACIRRLVAEFASALDEPGRLDGLEQIIRRAGLP